MSKSSHVAGGRAEPALIPETPAAPRRPIHERFGTQPQATNQTHDLREQLNNARRQPDQPDVASSRHELEVDPTTKELELL